MTDDLMEIVREANLLFRRVAEIGEMAARKSRQLSDEIDFIDAKGRQGPWVIVFGEPGPGALYYRNGASRQTANIDDAERFEVFQQQTRLSLGDRAVCVQLCVAEAAIGKAQGAT